MTRSIEVGNHSLQINDEDKTFWVIINDWKDITSPDAKLTVEVETLQREGYRPVYYTCECGCTIL